MPNENVRHACGSRSTSRTCWPSSRSATPIDATVVVFATPPFWFATASVRVIAPLCLASVLLRRWRTPEQITGGRHCQLARTAVQPRDSGLTACRAILSTDRRRESADGNANRCQRPATAAGRSEEHTSELQSRGHLVCRL